MRLKETIRLEHSLQLILDRSILMLALHPKTLDTSKTPSAPLQPEEEVQRWLGAAASSPAQGGSTLGALVGGTGVALPLRLEQRVGDAAGGGILGDSAGDDGGRQEAGAGGEGQPALAGVLQASGPHGREHAVDGVAARVGAVEAQPDVGESPQYSALSDTKVPVEPYQDQGMFHVLACCTLSDD